MSYTGSEVEKTENWSLRNLNIQGRFELKSGEFCKQNNSFHVKGLITKGLGHKLNWKVRFKVFTAVSTKIPAFGLLPRVVW